MTSTTTTTTTNKNIRDFGKIFDYLKDPELRKKEVGNAKLTVEGAVFSGEKFEDVEWHDIHFKNCDFVGAYELKPKSSTNVLYEDCRFSGVFGYGKALALHFLRCAWAPESNAYAGEGSRGVLFESCKFVGGSTDPNHWGAVGSDGEAEFVKCTANMFNLDGHSKLVIRGCELDNVICSPSARESGGVSSEMLIETSTLRGRFRMTNADLVSLTVRDTLIEGSLDMNNAKVKGDVLIERVQGGVIRGYVKHANSFTVRNSKIMGDGQDVFEAYAGGIKTIEIDGTVFGSGTAKGGNSTDGVTIGGGIGNDPAKPKPRVTERLTIRNSTIPQLNVDHIQAAEVHIENCDFAEANLSNSLLGVLRLDNARFAGALDMSNTRVRDLKQSGGTDLAKLGSRLKADGSNLKLPQ
ncbi:hypothetical protein DBV14_02515 [Variovorax sp. KBW07]|nr:hypothetical protein DBV14_02515 [Variovorax sp. KBW07]